MPDATLQTATPDIVLGDPANGAAMSMVDFRVYDRALSAAEIKALAQQGTEPAGDAPVGHWPLAEGAGTTCYDTSGDGQHGTATSITEGTFWGVTQDKVHRNITKGFAIRTENGPKVPVLDETKGAADGLATTHPAGQHHNQAETLIDFTGGTPDAPWQEGLTLPTDYAFGDALPAGMSKRTKTVNGIDREDRFYVLKQ